MEMNFLEIFGTIVGLVYLWLEYRASIYLWIAGIIMPAIYIFVYYKAGLYADFGINIYYLGAAIYGWTCWQVSSFKARNGKEKPGNVKEEAESVKVILEEEMSRAADFSVQLEIDLHEGSDWYEAK